MKKIKLILISCLFGSSLMAGGQYKMAVGEKLYFRAHWQNFTGGYAMVEIAQREQLLGQNTYRFRLRARSSQYMDSFYKVRYDWQSNWNFATRKPVKVTKRLQHGFDRRRYQMTFDWSKALARYQMKKYKANTAVFGIKKKDARWKEYKGVYARLPSETQDMLSALYYMRSDPRKGSVGTRFTMPLYDDGVMKRINFEVVKREKVNTPLGRFSALLVTTDFRTKGILRSQGKIKAWISDDKNRLPLKIKIHIPILDTVQVDLVKVERAEL